MSLILPTLYSVETHQRCSDVADKDSGGGVSPGRLVGLKSGRSTKFAVRGAA